MTEVERLMEAIKSLPEREYAELRRWFADRDLEMWDAEIESDSESGKLDFLAREALDEKESGKLREI